MKCELESSHGPARLCLGKHLRECLRKRHLRTGLRKGLRATLYKKYFLIKYFSLIKKRECDDKTLL